MAHANLSTINMKFTATFLTVCSAILFANGCAKSLAPKNPSPFKLTADGKPIIRLQQQWFANSGFAGEVWAMRQTASDYKFALTIIPGSDQMDTKQVVKLGEAEFGVAGAEQILKANENAAANLIVVGVINYQSLACFISKKPKGIMKPKDFEGHRVGTMEGSPVDLIYQALKKKLSLQIPPKDEIPTQWVLTGFIRDDYDVYPAFINDEPITLKRQGIDVNIVEPSHFDVNFIGTVYFCRREFAERYPEIVQAFVNAIADGWKRAIQDPKQAIAYLKDYDSNVDQAKETESLLTGRDFYKGEEGKILYCKASTWRHMADTLTDIGALKQPFDYNANVENKFVSWYHSRVSQPQP